MLETPNRPKPKRFVSPDELHPEAVTAWPRITVVTPTYNRDDFLEEAIRSVLNQDYPNLEYIVVDGGSTNPRVLEIIRKYENRLAWWISEPDKGHAEAIRKGFDRSTGEIVAWLCSDDFYLPGALRAVGEVFARWPQAEVVYGNMHLAKESGDLGRELRAVPYSRFAAQTAMNLHQPSAFWTRSLYLRVGGHVGGKNLEYAQYSPDTELLARFVKARAGFVLLRMALAASRIHAGTNCLREPGEVAELAWRAYRREFPLRGHPLVYPVVKLTARIRQLYWYIRLGDTDYLIKTFLSRLDGSRHS